MGLKDMRKDDSEDIVTLLTLYPVTIKIRVHRYTWSIASNRHWPNLPIDNHWRYVKGVSPDKCGCRKLLGPDFNSPGPESASSFYIENTCEAKHYYYEVFFLES